MTKTVTEREFNFFQTYKDANLNCRSQSLTIEYEGSTPPETVSVLIDGEIQNFRIKSFQRGSGIDSYLEKVYIKV